MLLPAHSSLEWNDHTRWLRAALHYLSHSCRQQSFAADVRIASQGVKTGPSEGLSFGSYDATNAFQSHASLTAHPNGTLAVVSEDLSLQPSQGTAMLGSGEMHTQKPNKDARNRLLWRDNTCFACTSLIMSWKAFLLLLLSLLFQPEMLLQACKLLDTILDVL